MKVLMISRATCFSPNSVEKDSAIFNAVADRLGSKGCEVKLISEDQCTGIDSLADTDLILTMARRPETLSWLEAVGVRSINSPQGIRNSSRSHLHALMSKYHIPMPPQTGKHGYWVKRGDAAAQTPEDVVYAPDDRTLDEAIRQMEARGNKDYTVSAHVEGDLVKFYGVSGTGFFHYCYPTDNGQTKFGDECHNSVVRHYHFSEQQLQYEAERLADAAGIVVWGGDAIVRADGSFCLIDFNDWPSFSSCREAAADAIVETCHV